MAFWKSMPSSPDLQLSMDEDDEGDRERGDAPGHSDEVVEVEWRGGRSPPSQT